jgi:hypothetical protein
MLALSSLEEWRRDLCKGVCGFLIPAMCIPSCIDLLWRTGHLSITAGVLLSLQVELPRKYSIVLLNFILSVVNDITCYTNCGGRKYANRLPHCTKDQTPRIHQFYSPNSLTLRKAFH